MYRDPLSMAWHDVPCPKCGKPSTFTKEQIDDSKYLNRNGYESGLMCDECKQPAKNTEDHAIAWMNARDAEPDSYWEWIRKNATYNHEA